MSLRRCVRLTTWWTRGQATAPATKDRTLWSTPRDWRKVSRLDMKQAWLPFQIIPSNSIKGEQKTRSTLKTISNSGIGFKKSSVPQCLINQRPTFLLWWAPLKKSAKARSPPKERSQCLKSPLLGAIGALLPTVLMRPRSPAESLLIALRLPDTSSTVTSRAAPSLCLTSLERTAPEVSHRYRRRHREQVVDKINKKVTIWIRQDHQWLRKWFVENNPFNRPKRHKFFKSWNRRQRKLDFDCNFTFLNFPLKKS